VLALLAQDDLAAGPMATHLPDDRPASVPATAGIAPSAATAMASAKIIIAQVPDLATAAPAAPNADVPGTPARATIGPDPAASGEVRAFRKGDLVVYPAHGIGTVDQVRVEEIGGQKLNWIKISFAENRMCLRVPVRKAQDIGLRRPVSRQAFAEVLTIIRGRPHANRLVWTKRALEYQGKINSGCVKALAEVVRDLRPSLDGSESSFSRRNLFESAVDRLAGEFAAVFRTDKAAAVGRLMAAPRAG
jgi:CarD family transcriptional regulator